MTRRNSQTRVVVRNFQARPIIDAAWLRAMTETVLEETRAGPAGDAGPEAGPAGDAVAFAFVDEARMREIHGRWRGDAVVTDVLAFPAADSALPGEVGERDLGDVILCTDQAQRQARRLGLPYPVELRILALHGLLHLLGYDHTRDRGEMRALERRLRPRLLGCRTSSTG